jgi:hypothetical protein
MNKEILLTQIKQEFKDLTLGDTYTLAEEDYADTSHWHFDEKHIDSNLTREEWDKQEIEEMIKHRWWLPEEIEEAIKAIKEKRKMSNRFPNPLEIPYLYLNKYRVGFIFLKPQAYLFYTPSIMIHKLCNPDYIDGFSFNSWLNVLVLEKDDLNILSYFSKKQFNVLINFLEYLIHLNTVDEFDKENIQIALKKIQLFKSE